MLTEPPSCVLSLNGKPLRHAFTTQRCAAIGRFYLIADLLHCFMETPALVRTAPLLLVLCLLLTAQTPSLVPLNQTLRESRGKKRVLLIIAPNAGQADFKTQKTLLAAHPQGLADRDLLVLEVLYDQLSAADRQALRQRVGLELPGFCVALIGKDGGVKEKSQRPITPASLFDTVDKMPMRREEMRRK